VATALAFPHVNLMAVWWLLLVYEWYVLMMMVVIMIGGLLREMRVSKRAPLHDG
jgi:hypothetical protein